MIVIKNIELIETDSDWFEYIERNEPMLLNCYNMGQLAAKKEDFQRKIIKGRRFRRPDGEMIIGVSDEAGEILGLMYESWDNMESFHANNAESLQRRLNIKDKEIKWLKVPFYKKIAMAITDCVKYEQEKTLQTKKM